MSEKEVCNANDDAFAGETENGLTKREYFAGQILAGMFNRPEMINECSRMEDRGDGKALEILATSAIKQADALIKELNGGQAE